MKEKNNIVIGVTGSIASYKACELISSLKKEGFDITVVLTKEAKEFITKLTFETISGNKVYDEMFQSPEEWDIKHIALSKKADLVIIAPATANIISKIASGICDDALTTLVCATKSPILIAPAMNEAMYTNPIITDNIAKLKKLGYKFVGPIKGRLACGIEGVGHISEISDIVSLAKKILK